MISDVGDSLGFCPKNISARAIHSGGAMARLLDGVDYDKIKLLRRCRFNEI